MTENGREYLKAICLAEFKRHGRVTPCRIPKTIANSLLRLRFIAPAVAPPGYSAEGLFVPTDAGRRVLRFNEAARGQLRTMNAGKGRPVFIPRKAVAADLLALGYIGAAGTLRGHLRYMLTQAGREAIEDADASPAKTRSKLA